MSSDGKQTEDAEAKQASNYRITSRSNIDCVTTKFQLVNKQLLLLPNAY